MGLAGVQQRDQRELMNGFGDGLARAFEIAVIPVIFCGIGWVIDQRLNTQPLFILVFLLVAVVGLGIREWVAYDAAMKVEEDRRMAQKDGRAT